MPYRVLHLIDSLGYGGTERQLVLNLSLLQGEQFENQVCYLHPPADLQGEITRLGIPVYSLGLTGSYQWAQGIVRLRRLIRQVKPDLIHTNLFEADVIGGVSGRLLKVPVVSTIANQCFELALLVDNPRMTRFKMVFPRTVRSLVARACNARLIAVSQAVAESVAARLKVPQAKITIIHRALGQQWLGSPELVNRQELCQELGLEGAYPILLNVGRLIPEKGQRYLLEAMPQVLRQFPQAALLIAGNGFLEPVLLELRDRLGIQGQVIVLGHRNDVKELLGLSDIFVFPSLSEGCPNALIEAMARGKPCVASDISAVAEALVGGEEGLLTPPRDASALAEAINWLAAHPQEATQMGQQARATAQQRFTLEAATTKLTSLYLQVIDRRQERHRQPGQVK